jgi:hypothetical protein
MIEGNDVIIKLSVDIDILEWIDDHDDLDKMSQKDLFLLF